MKRTSRSCGALLMLTQEKIYIAHAGLYYVHTGINMLTQEKENRSRGFILRSHGNNYAHAGKDISLTRGKNILLTQGKEYYAHAESVILLNSLMQRTVWACHNSCGNGPQELRQKRPNPLTEKRSAAADQGVRLTKRTNSGVCPSFSLILKICALPALLIS